MQRIVAAALVLLIGASAAGPDEPEEKPPTTAERYHALARQFHEAARAFYVQVTADEEPIEPVERIAALSQEILELAEKNPADAIALDALVQVVLQEIYLENNTSHPGRGDENLQARAIAILLRDHVRSDRLGDACRRMSYGFSKECESFLRTVLNENPHEEVQALACLRLAQFLKRRLERLDLVAERPHMARRYEGLFGKEYLAALYAGRARAVGEAEALFQRAIDEYGEAVGAKARSELHEMRFLSVGNEAPQIDGHDQEGRRFRLSDYRGKVVLLYFWSEY